MDYDLVIIGAGWAGFNAALKARALGLKVALIEKDQIGGTCLNRGCIPTKALIHSAKVYRLAKKSASFGIELKDAPVANFLKIQEKKEALVKQLSGGMQFLLKGIDFFTSPAEIISNQEIKIADGILKTKFILIASGSRPMELPSLKFDGRKVLSSDDLLNIKDIPRSILIIGAGVIGCEFAVLFNALGSAVSMAEKMPQALPGIDQEVAKKLENIFKKSAIKVTTNCDATALDLSAFDLVLLCVGRKPQSDGLGLEKLGLATQKSKILVDKYLKTNIPNIYAAGDCTGGIMLAHYAAYQGELAAENIARQDSQKEIGEAAVPSCIFTYPEIATVGLSEEQVSERGLKIKVQKFDFLGSGLARIMQETEGFIKIIYDHSSAQILGASIIGPSACELIGILTLAVSARLKVSDIQNTIFAHPTLSESIGSALKDYHAA
jgi:dihydrolipoamide dehydrogenase